MRHALARYATHVATSLRDFEYIYYYVYTMQTLAHTKATGTEEVLRRLERELRVKLGEKTAENNSLSQKVTVKEQSSYAAVYIIVLPLNFCVVL